MSHIDLRTILAYNMAMVDMREPEPLDVFVLDAPTSSTMANYTNSPPALSTAGRAFLCCQPREKSDMLSTPKTAKPLINQGFHSFSLGVDMHKSQVTPWGGVVVAPPMPYTKTREN